MTIKIFQPKSLTKKSILELNSILYELKASLFKPLSIEQWRKILDQKDVKLFTALEARLPASPKLQRGEPARQGKIIIGMAMLRWHWLSGGKAGTVEDVIVSLKYQRQGYGSELMRAIIKFAKKENMVYIDLTSQPSRIAASKLYQKYGWKIRKTNVYRLDMCGVGHRT